MKHNLSSLKVALAIAPAVVARTRLTRLVPFQPLITYNPPNWLYASGNPNRYNPAGVKCVYFAESKEAAHVEYEAGRARAGKYQPVTLYAAEVALGRVLDLTSPATLKVLSMDSKDLFENWRRRTKTPTTTQLLGQAVNETRLFSAIRYPSKAAISLNLTGINYVIFQDCVVSPDSVQVLGSTIKPLQSWP